MNYLKIIPVLILLIGCDDIVEVEDISQQTVTVLAPVTNSVFTDGTLSLSWAALNDADHYRLQVATPTFAEATQIIVDSLLTLTNFTMEFSPNAYQWRVRAENSGYVTAFSIQDFLVELPDAVDISTKSVVLLAPAEGLSFTPTDKLNFSWESLLNAESYSIQIAVPNFENVIEIISNETLTATSFSTSNLAVNNYEWRVRALNSDSQTVYTTQSFIVEE